MMPLHPAHFGPAMLYHLKRGKPVERITVWFTHAQLHRMFSEHLAKNFPLEVVLAEGMDMEKRIDYRFHEAPWHIDVRTDEQKQAANRDKSAPDPTPPAPTQPTEQEVKVMQAVLDLLEPYASRAESEYRQLAAALRRKSLLASPDRQDQTQSEDTAHAQ